MTIDETETPNGNHPLSVVYVRSVSEVSGPGGREL